MMMMIMSPCCWRVWTTVMPRWLASLPPYSTVSSRSRTLRLGQSLAYVARIISQSLWPVFNGFVHPSESRSSSRLSSSTPCTAQLLDTCRINYIRVADMPSWSRLRSASSNRLDVRPSRLVTVGERSFSSAGPRVWNSLPEDVISAPSLPVFLRKLKTHLFRHSYPDIVTAPQWFLEVFLTIGHYKKLLCNVV